MCQKKSNLKEDLLSIVIVSGAIMEIMQSFKKDTTKELSMLFKYYQYMFVVSDFNWEVCYYILLIMPDRNVPYKKNKGIY